MGNHRDYATVSENAVNYGAQSDINLWEPSVAEDFDHTISQIWVGGGSPGTNQRQTVEVGWRRLGWLDNVRLFVYSDNGTSRGYGTAGGFVQTSHAIALDTKFASVSITGGAQQERKFKILKDGDNGHWYFYYQGNRIGYWPRARFATTGLANNSSDYKFGGEVFNSRSVVTGRHTKTDMGGGEFASKGYRHAAYQHNLSTFKKVAGVVTMVDANITAAPLITSGKCYDLKLTKDLNNAWRTWIYFGGAGYNLANGCDLSTD
jgi:hypothetical protein